MGKLIQEFLEREKALELAKEVEKVKEDMTNQLNVKAVIRLVEEQYKKAQSPERPNKGKSITNHSMTLYH